MAVRSGTMRSMPSRDSATGWRSASTWAAVAATLGAVYWWGLLGMRITGLTGVGNDRAMGGLFVAGAIMLSCVAVPGLAVALTRPRVHLPRGLVLAVAMAVMVAYLWRLSAGHVPVSDADYRGSSDTDIMLVAVGWTFIAWLLWRVRQGPCDGTAVG